MTYAITCKDWLGRWSVHRAGQPHDDLVQCKSRVDAEIVLRALNRLTPEEHITIVGEAVAACDTPPDACPDCGRTRPCYSCTTMGGWSDETEEHRHVA